MKRMACNSSRWKAANQSKRLKDKKKKNKCNYIRAKHRSDNNKTNKIPPTPYPAASAYSPWYGTDVCSIAKARRKACTVKIF